MNNYQYNQATTSAGVTGVTPPGVAVLRGRNPHIKVKRTCIQILCEPAAIFLYITLLITALATALLYNALTSRYWEMMIYDQDTVIRLVENRTQLTLEWLVDERVCKITNVSSSTGNFMEFGPTQTGPDQRGNGHSIISNSLTAKLHDNNQQTHSGHKDDHHGTNESNGNGQHQEDVTYEPVEKYLIPGVTFLIPLHSGIWITCFDLTDAEFFQLGELGYASPIQCVDHLNPDSPKPLDGRKWQHRMQNLACACAMVCLILLGAAVVVGLFGILRRQISAILVTGVIYVLAALFALFTLTIAHLKHKNRRENEMLDVWTQLTPDYVEYSTARIINHGWSLHLGWAGSFVCVLASVMWILLSKIMRYNPISCCP